MVRWEKKGTSFEPGKASGEMRCHWTKLGYRAFLKGGGAANEEKNYQVGGAEKVQTGSEVFRWVDL